MCGCCAGAVVTTTSAITSGDGSYSSGDLASEKSYEKNDRTDLESLQPTAELCAWYRTRIAGFEAERAELLQRLTRCNPQREELHKTDWELRKKMDEVKDLQKVCALLSSPPHASAVSVDFRLPP
jgi:chromosome segregation ATPase